MTTAIAVGALVTAGVYLLSRRGALPLVLGFVLLGHAANLVLLSAGGTDRREPPIIGPDLDPGATADPLPQAFVLTAIVITFGVTVFLLALVARSRAGTDEAADTGPDPAPDDGAPPSAEGGAA